jgi:hypothetical protein
MIEAFVIFLLLFALGHSVNYYYVSYKQRHCLHSSEKKIGQDFYFIFFKCDTCKQIRKQNILEQQSNQQIKR